jgi:two-component system cell cycle sensor histidine kinase PleC
MKDLNVISTPVAPVAPDTRCGIVFERFQADPNLVAIPVTTRGKPEGLLKRTEFLISLGDRFGRPLYENRPVTELMDREPLIVDEQTALERLHDMLIHDKRDALQDGFIVTEDGFYKGIGTSYTLLQLNMRRAEQRMVELETARMEAEAATRSRSQFLANMSHELRTPLNAVIGFADFILSERGRGRSVDDIWSYVNDIRDSGTHLLGVINSILDFSKLEANAFKLREDYEAPQEIIHSVVRMLTGAAQAKTIDLVITADDVGVELHADIQVTKQILINLVSNAIKFSPKASEVHISLSLLKDKSIRYSVADNGPGMAADVLERVLEPFEQADAGLSRRHEGTGLGLPLVKAFAEAHGGTLTLESTVGVGTRAIVTFPPERTVDQASFEFAAI